MENIEETLATLRTKITAAEAARTRASVESENAIKARDQALAGLKEFGVTTTAQATEKLAELKADLDAALAEVESALTESGA